LLIKDFGQQCGNGSTDWSATKGGRVLVGRQRHRALLRLYFNSSAVIWWSVGQLVSWLMGPQQGFLGFGRLPSKKIKSFQVDTYIGFLQLSGGKNSDFLALCIYKILFVAQIKVPPGGIICCTKKILMNTKIKKVVL
jgi:hypothetical protein